MRTVLTSSRRNARTRAARSRPPPSLPPARHVPAPGPAPHRAAPRHEASRTGAGSTSPRTHLGGARGPRRLRSPAPPRPRPRRLRPGARTKRPPAPLPPRAARPRLRPREVTAVTAHPGLRAAAAAAPPPPSLPPSVLPRGNASPHPAGRHAPTARRGSRELRGGGIPAGGSGPRPPPPAAKLTAPRAPPDFRQPPGTVPGGSACCGTSASLAENGRRLSTASSVTVFFPASGQAGLNTNPRPAVLWIGRGKHIF